MITAPTAPWVHPIFETVAWLCGLGVSLILYRWRLSGAVQASAGKVGGGYFVALALGAIPGGWLAGSFNSLRQDAPSLSHSVAGALVGAIIGVEIYKALRGVRSSTGGVFVGSFSLGVVIGRLGCFFAGVADGTYGVATRLPWGVNLGDGVARHPVQLYESVSMAAFLAVYLIGLNGRRDWAMRRGFYAMCVVYGAQRFVWEFFKPYPKLIGPFNVFHLLCVGLVAYGWIYDRRERRRQYAQERALPVPWADNQPL